MSIEISRNYTNDIKPNIQNSCYENLPKYPGMCRPYNQNNNNNTTQQQTLPTTKINAAKVNNRVNATFNPFSMYDDESASDHYFIVPATHLDLQNFKRTFIEANKCKLNVHQKHSKINSTCQHNRKSNHHILLKEQHQALLKKHQQKTLNGDYCTISQSAKPLIKSSHITSSMSDNIKTDTNMTDFASKLVTSDNHIIYDDKKMKRTKEELIQFHCSPKSFKKAKKQHKTNKFIDLCTCMTCVKAVSYHFTGDDTDEYIDPCSCTGGSTKSIAGRWLCMGALALFLPCLLCYLPAKLCHNSCSKDTCRNRLKCPITDDTYEVRYVKDPTDNSTLL